MVTEERKARLLIEQSETLLELKNAIEKSLLNPNIEASVADKLREYKDSIIYVSVIIYETESAIKSHITEVVKKVELFKDYEILQEIVNHPNREIYGLKERLLSLKNQKKLLFDIIFIVGINY